MRSAVRVELVLVLIPLILISIFTCAAAVSEVRCKEAERESLLDFKLSFTADPDGSLSSWSANNSDCCHWNGVICDDDTGHVNSIDVSQRSLVSHRLRPSLLGLQHLISLDLSGNSFKMRIPEFIGSLAKLEAIDLSQSGFYGKIPPHLGNLTHLRSLDFSGYLNSPSLLYSDNLQWLSHLSSLTWLDLSGVNLSTATNWVFTLKRLPSISSFTCLSCSFPLTPQPTCPNNHSTFLQIVELSYSQISFSDFFCLINGTSSLFSLSLASMEQNPNDFFRPLFQFAARSMLFSVLETLDISRNQLSDSMLAKNSSAPKLEILDISHNIINTLPDLSKFSSLTNLDASFNSLNIIISDSNFSKISNLQKLDFSYNHVVTFNFSRSWVPPFNLTDLCLRSCNVGSHFPNWVWAQKGLDILDISNSSILGVIPDSFWNGITNLSYLNVSNNKIQGILPNVLARFQEVSTIDMSFNSFHGPIPLFLFSGQYLDLSNNNFSSFSTSYHKVPDNALQMINLSNNLLSGSLPGWIFHFNDLGILNVENNKLTGDIPSSIASSWGLNALHMNNNRFSGELPSSMKSCTKLVILELGNNNFSGSLPLWIGDRLRRLSVLNMRSNAFTAELPSNLCNLQMLQVLDLSGNRLSGSIPGCVGNFTFMTVDQGSNFINFVPEMELLLKDLNMYASIRWKGVLESESGIVLPQIILIDLSSNRLTGTIPSGFTTLTYLESLDLSSNDLNGSIPDKIGQLKHLEVLKLSSNRLGGEIPQSLADLTFLNTLNLSSNNFSGEIPKSTQLQSLDPSSYGENPELCGEPLPTLCAWDKGSVNPSPSEKDHAEEGQERFDFEAFYAALGAGFASGLFGILGLLHFHAPSRHTFFHMASEVGDWIFVWTMLCKCRIKRRLCFSKEKEASTL